MHAGMVFAISTLILTFRAAEVVKQYPNIVVMVNHCGLPYEKDEANMKLWKEGMTMFVLERKCVHNIRFLFSVRS